VALPAEETVRALHWFRSDLRLRDNAALAEAAARGERLVCAFVLDDRLLGEAGAPARVRFLLDCLARLDAELRRRGQRLVVRHGDPRREIPRLIEQARIGLLTFDRDYGPFARRRDAAISRDAEKQGVAVVDCKDRVVFEGSELRTQQGTPYRVFTPFKNAWWRRYREEQPGPIGPIRLPPPVGGLAAGSLPDAEALGVAGDATEIPVGGEEAARRRLRSFLDGPVGRYREDRDLPALDGTSRLSPYLRLGAISARTCVDAALELARVEPKAESGVRSWVDELVWRDFYHAVLSDNPHVLRANYRPEFDRVRWNDDEAGFAAWCEGRTGFPIVDAGMRQLARTGWMHNRVRMIVAGFLTKDLLVDWRRGERFFYAKLVDGDPAANNGGWQWAASTGTDAQPWFRIFNPVTQGERFDSEGVFVRRFLPELAEVPDRFVHRPWQAPTPPAGYSAPIVDHASRRLEALRRFEVVRSG
jgi:deoxyribodipyrimidine photo-lyase